jgi:chromosome segregation ATPase
MIPQRIEVIKKTYEEIKEKVATLISYLTLLNNELDTSKTDYETLEAKTKILAEKSFNIDTKIAELKEQEIRNKVTNEERARFEGQKVQLTKERLMITDKQKYLENKESKLNDKAQRLQTMLTE